jgi:inosose dehydratase
VRREVFQQLGEDNAGIGQLLGLLGWEGYRGWYVLDQDIVVEAEPEEGEEPLTHIRESLDFLERELEEVG